MNYKVIIAVPHIDTVFVEADNEDSAFDEACQKAADHYFGRPHMDTDSTTLVHIEKVDTDERNAHIEVTDDERI